MRSRWPSALALLGAVALLAACQAKSQVVVVEQQPAREQTSFRITEGACEITWILSQSAVNMGVVSHRSKCAFPFQQQLPLLRLIAERASQEGLPISTLNLGRLSAFAGLPERLATLASQSTRWNSATGAPASGGSANTVVMQLANQGQLFKELQELLKTLGYESRVSAIEHVSVVKDPGSPRRLPRDCEVWLSVSRPGGKDGKRI